MEKIDLDLGITRVTALSVVCLHVAHAQMSVRVVMCDYDDCCVLNLFLYLTND